ncbi:MAG: ACT domain-containing protein, partial [Bacteroidota bacterium]
GGDLKKLPKDSTALDFAFEIHSQVGSHCLGAKVNNKLVPLSFRLKSGDQVEIITSKKQTPKEDWLKYVVTAKAKSRIKDLLKEEKKRIALEGKDILHKKFDNLKIPFSSENITIVEKLFHEDSTQELYFKIAKNKINLNKLKEMPVVNGRIKLPEEHKPEIKTGNSEEMLEMLSRGKGKDKVIVLGDTDSSFDYKLSPCCNPIPGDKVFGFLTINEGIKIHRLNCPNAVQLMSNYAYRIIQAKWNSDNEVEFLAGVKFKGIDDIGLVHRITSTISNQMNINMRSISFESNDGIFEGKIVLYVNDTDHLQRLTSELKNISGIYSVERVEVE